MTVTQSINSISYQLQEPFDMSFISKYGKVFKVFDKQDSGCIAFGVQSKDKKLFLKFAGAKPIHFKGLVEDVISTLKSGCKVYKDLRHKSLVNLIGEEQLNNGYLAIFEWTDSLCMGKQYDDRPKFFELPIVERIKIFEDILEFHRFVVKQGYVAIDFYDGSIMYDFMNKKTIICDIDCYAKKPYINNMGRMWGSSRFMSPEEFEKGSIIDEITNVYLMGATAFVLLGDGRDKTLEKWNASKSLFTVAKKAISKDRNNRYQTLDKLKEDWLINK